MKKILAIVLVLAMIVCMVPAFAVSAAEGDTECTVTEHNEEQIKLFGNIVDGDGVGWYYYTGNDAPKVNWKTPDLTQNEVWKALEENQLFDNDRKGTVPKDNEGEPIMTDVWQNNGSLWAVRKVTLTAAEFEQYKDKPLTTKLRYCNGIGVYINGNKVFVNSEGGNGWQDSLTTVNLNINLGDAFKQADGTYIVENDEYVAYVAAYVYNMNNYWFDMSLDVVMAYNEVTIANADQWNDYVKREADANNNLDGNIPVRVTVTGDLNFTDKTYAPIGSLSNTTIDFGNHVVSGIDVSCKNYKDEGGKDHNNNQFGIIAVEATNNSVIKNLYLKDCSATVDHDGVYIGATWLGSVIGWASNASVSNVTLDNVTLTNNCEDATGTAYTGIGAVVGVSNNRLAVDNVTIKNSTFNAPKNKVSIIVARHGAELGNHTFSNIKVESATVDALYYGVSREQQFCYMSSATVFAGDNVDLSGVTVLNHRLAASANGYSAYFQTRDGATEGTKDFRIIVAATEAYVNQLIDLGVAIDFDVTFRSTAGNENVSKTLTANKVYSSIKAMNGDVEVTYSAAANTYIFGWVITGVPADYANETGTAVPVLNMKIVSDKYQEIELTYTKSAYYNSDNGNADLTTGWGVFYATQLFEVKDGVPPLPVGTIITVDSNWQYRAERWGEGDVRPEGMDRPGNVTTNITVIDENWWGKCTKCGINVSKISQTNITEDEMGTIRLHIYKPVEPEE